MAAGTARGKDFVGGCTFFLWLTPKFDEKGVLIENTKVALTAPSGRQVENIMYPEVSRLYNNSLLKYGRLVQIYEQTMTVGS